MIVIHCFKGKKVALFGLGGSGIATTHALIAGGANVIAWDDNEKSVEKARLEQIDCANLNDIDFSSLDAVILAPGVPLTHPEPHWVVKKANQNKVEIIGDIELFIRERNIYLQNNKLQDKDIPFIAITGTNGKSTTTALINHLLQWADKDVQMGGNIGTAILSLEEFKPNRFYVIECSSFQIDLTPSMKPTIGILLNITPDHIDRHGSFVAYAAIKERVVANSCLSLVGIDDDASREIYERLIEHQKTCFAVAKEREISDGYYSLGTELFYAQSGQSEKIASLKDIASLRGSHNAQNALMALGVLRGLNIKLDHIDDGLKSFDGLSHRMQQVRQIGHILFINDSKATNAEASAPALASFDHIYWIAGGLAKEGGIETLRGYFPKIKKAYLIGNAAKQFALTIGNAIPISMSDTLEQAIQDAFEDAKADKKEEAAIVLSPACASYDQFPNYTTRGNRFVEFVEKLSDQ